MKNDISRFIKVFFLLFIVGMSFTTELYAWQTNGVAICTSTNRQDFPTIISDGAGGAIITWQDIRNGANLDIYVQRVDSNGSPLWTNNGVTICNAANQQYFPKLISDESGGAIITWFDNRSGASKIYAQRVNSNGSTLWASNGVSLCTAANAQDYPSIDSDGAGGAIISWRDYRNNSDHNIYAQHVDSSGSNVWSPNGVPICTASNEQENQMIVSDGSGGAIISWQDFRTGAIYNDIYAQHVNSSGSTLWTSNGIPVCTAVNILSLGVPIIVSDSSGGALITWEDFRNGNADLYAQRVNSSGSTLWINNGVAICTAALTQQYAAAVSDGLGGVIITWDDDRNDTTGSGGNYDIYAQRVNSNGSTLWIFNGVGICTAVHNQGYPSIDIDGSGGGVITWYDGRNGSTFNIYAQRVNSNGSTLWILNGAAVCTIANTPYNPLYPAIVGDGSGGAIITWWDTRHDLGDIYAERVNVNGLVPINDWFNYAGDMSLLKRE